MTTTNKQKTGPRATYSSTPVHALLAQTLPSDYVVRGKIDTKMLSTSIGRARYHVERHLSENRLSSQLASLLVKLSNASTTDNKGLITPESLARFVIES